MKYFASLLLILTGPAVQASPQEFETLAVVRELEEVKVPAQRDGLLAELSVRRGHPVSAGQLIAQLDTTEIKLRLNVRQADVNKAKVESGLVAELGDNAVYLERFRLENQLEKSMGELRILENDLRQTAVHAPVDGLVRELLKHQGEWVKQGEPIAAITRMDRLIVEGFLDSRLVAPHAVTGAKARVVIPLAGGSPAEFDGLTIRYAAPKLELDGKFPVWVEIENPRAGDEHTSNIWLIRPGMSGSLTVILE
jgi:multidrug efflux pump subunit AcrA (membrane-fusion protein)